MRMAEKWNEKWPKDANCVMISQSQCIGIPNMMLEGSVSPVPPVRRAMNLPRPSTMMDPESPCTENGPCYSCRWLLPPNPSNGCIWYWGTHKYGIQIHKRVQLWWVRWTHALSHIANGLLCGLYSLTCLHLWWRECLWAWRGLQLDNQNHVAHWCEGTSNL